MGLLLRGGRVVDPASGLDEVTDVLVEGDRVAAVGPGLVADRVLDVTGLVVGPGFVDLHSHVHSVAGQRLQALDGVTTALDLEAGLMPVGRAYADAAAQGRPLHYGFSAQLGRGAGGRCCSGASSDASILDGLAVLGEQEWQRDSTREELARWVGLLRGELADGALGIGVLQGYAPRTDPAELVAVGRLAAEAGRADVHARAGARRERPDDAGRRLVGDRAGRRRDRRAHAPLPRNGTTRRHVDRVLGTLAQAQAEGSRVTVEAYPYGAGSTGIGAAFLAPERLAPGASTRAPGGGADRGSGCRRGAAARAAGARRRYAGAWWSSSTRRSRPTARCCSGRWPSRTRSSPATRCRCSSRTAAPTAAVAAAARAARPTRAPPARSPSRCG